MRTASLLFAMALATSSALRMNRDMRTGLNESKPVFYAIIMGPLAYKHQVSTWLFSLRMAGEFTDEVVIVTDKPTCLAKTLAEAKLLGGQISSTDSVDIYLPGQGMLGNIHIVKRPELENDHHHLLYKLEKARAWTNVEAADIPHPVSSIIYTDEDVVMGEPLHGFELLVKGLEVTQHTMGLFNDPGVGGPHTGVVVMLKNENAKKCLEAWGKRLEHGALATPNTSVAFDRFDREDLEAQTMISYMGPDQDNLRNTAECGWHSTDANTGIKVLPKQYFWLPDDQGMQAGKTADFIHFTNSHRVGLIGPKNITMYLHDILALPNHLDPWGHIAKNSC